MWWPPLMLVRAARVITLLFKMAYHGNDFDAMFTGPLKVMYCQQPLYSPTASPTASSLHLIGSNAEAPYHLNLCSWNLLASPYVRPDRESTEAGLDRAKRAIAIAAESLPDVLGLQEFWCAEPRHVELWRGFAEAHGYVLHVCARPNGKADGCAMLIRASKLARPPIFAAFHYDDWGSRVVQQCTLELIGTSSPVVLLHTHLTFPHRSEHDPVMRCHQARKLSELARKQTSPTVVFGDLNNPSTDDPALSKLIEIGGLRNMPERPDEDEISHIAHTGALMACDRALTRGPCHVVEWRLGSTQDALVSRSLVSDHRPLHAQIMISAE